MFRASSWCFPSCSDGKDLFIPGTHGVARGYLQRTVLECLEGLGPNFRILQELKVAKFCQTQQLVAQTLSI